MEKIGRLGYIGLAIEATSGSAEATPDVFIPVVENSMRGHHEPLMDISSRAGRGENYSSVAGKKWGEGSIKMYLDSMSAGYLLKMTFGTESRAQLVASPPVHDHDLYPTISGNSMTTATLWDYKGFDVEQYTYAVADTCEIEVNTDGIATITAGLKAKAPATVTAPTLTTVSGTLYTWKDMNVYFGDTVVAALASTPVKLTGFKCQYANNASLNYKSGSQSPDTITSKQWVVKGSYNLFFENATDRDRYYNLTKKSMVVRLTGANLGSGGYAEKMDFIFKQVMLDNVDIATGLNDLFALTCNFTAENNVNQGGDAECVIRNGKATDYA